VATSQQTTPQYQTLIRELGFDSEHARGVISGDELQAARSNTGSSYLIDKHFRYASVLKDEKLGITDVFEVNGTPCIYFKSLAAEPTGEDIKKWHRTAWNHGLGRMLWVVTPTSVRVLNAFKPPDSVERRNKSAHPATLLQESIDNLQRLRELELTRIGIESGQFWATGIGRKVDKSERIDRELAGDLELAAKELVKVKCKPLAAHRLMLRTLFIAYLEARGVLPKTSFDGLKAGTFAEVLTSVKETKTFFERMQTTFNGDLFPPPPSNAADTLKYTKAQLEIARSIVIRRDLTTGQLSFDFGRYDFEVIPIELISSIYERFIYADDARLAKQRGTHYTPVNLVDLVFSQVFDDGLFSSSLPKKPKVLDLACGSGVFLVDAFRRLVARRVAVGKEKLTRGLVRDVLSNQLFGVDLEPTAIEIAAFSLCLTAFELDPSPNSVRQLRFRESLKGRNLFVGDAFQETGFAQKPVFAKKQFSIVVGNPPWKKTTGSKSSAETSGKSHLRFCAEQDPPIPLGFRSPIDQAFLWRSQYFCEAGGRIGLILDAKNFFSPQETSITARKAIFEQMNPRVLLNLSSLHDKRLFPSAKQPAMITIVEQCEPQSNQETIIASTERTETFTSHGIVELYVERINKLPRKNILNRDYSLKLGINGGPRDAAILADLYERYSTVEDVLSSWGTALMPGYKGRGKGPRTPAKMRNLRMLEDEELRVLFHPSRCLPKLTHKKLDRPRDLTSYASPLAVVEQKLIGNRLAATTFDTDVAYTCSYSGVPVGEAFRAEVLACYLNSALAAFAFLHTATRFGIGRQIAPQVDIANLPFRDFVEKDSRAFHDMVKRVKSGKSLDDFQKLDEAVFDFFELEHWKRDYITDVVDFEIDFVRKGSRSQGCLDAEPQDLIRYADTLRSELRRTLPDCELKFNADVIAGLPDVRAVVIRLDESRHRKTRQVVTADFPNAEALSELLHGPLSDSFRLRRSMVYFDGDRCIIVKLAQRRFWSRVKAMTDADTVLTELMSS
jgi:SAM-dependent methyltransferase